MPGRWDERDNGEMTLLAILATMTLNTRTQSNGEPVHPPIDASIAPRPDAGPHQPENAPAGAPTLRLVTQTPDSVPAVPPPAAEVQPERPAPRKPAGPPPAHQWDLLWFW